MLWRADRLFARADRGSDIETQEQQTIAVVGDAFRLESAAGLVVLPFIGTAVVTLTSTPQITAGKFDGQMVLLRCLVGSTAITLQDESGLAGSKLRLPAATQGVNARDTIGFVWVQSVAEWYHCITRTSNL